MSVWNLSGTSQQQAIINDALAKCDFPYDRLVAGLQKQTGNSTIVVEWSDLSRSTEASNEKSSISHVISSPENRAATLGLAWTNGRIQIDQSLINDTRLAQEVFLAESAHMVDFFYMTDADRTEVKRVMHGGSTAQDGHDWFDVGPYETWTGEAFMGQFIKSFAPTVKVTLTQFVHQQTIESTAAVRRLLLRDSVPTPPVAGVAMKFTANDVATLDKWAASPHIWRNATSAAKAWKNGQRT